MWHIAAILAILQVPVAETPTRARHAPSGDYVSWREHRIDDEELGGVAVRGADGLAIGDLDGDGYIDVVSVHEDSSHVRIAFGSDDPDRWELGTLAEGDLVGAAEDVDIGDVDGDDRDDIVVACEKGHVVVFVSPPNPRDMRAWTAAVLAATRDRGSWIRVKLADMDGDGRLDVVAANKGQTSVSMFRLLGDASDANAWIETVIGRCRAPINVRPIDLDGDGDLDLIASSRGEHKIYYYENPGDDSAWRETVVHERKPLSQGFMMAFADIDGDHRIDIVTEADTRQVFWLRQPANVTDRWAPHVIGSTLPDQPTGLRMLDLTGDGRLDLFVGGYSSGPRLREPDDPSPSDVCGRLAWFEQPADPRDPWTRHDVSRRRRAMYDAFVARDMNGDGLLDLITTRGNSGEFDGVLWLEQVHTPQPVPAFSGARDHDSRQMPLPE